MKKLIFVLLWLQQKPQKGKQGTRGIKQIVEENQQTLTFYRNMVVISNAVFLAVTCVFFELLTTFNIVSVSSHCLFISILCVIVHIVN